MRLLLVLFAAAALAADIDEAKLVDLTHAFDDRTIHWPTAKPFVWYREAWGMGEHGWYASASFEASEHLGTHLDSPIHFAENQAATDQIPLPKLVGPAALIDIRAEAARNRDYQLSGRDIEAWEKQHGRIAPGTIVVVRTGWSRFWPDRLKYMGSDKSGDISGLHFPGIAPEAAKLLAERKVDGVGIDTASLDHGPSKDFRAHRILNGAGIYGIENLAALDRIPPRGATLIVMPMKIRGGTGGPARVAAVLP